MLEKISGCILVLSLAMNFAVIGLWASGGLHHALRVPEPESPGRRPVREKRIPQYLPADAAPGAASVSRAVARVWHLPGPDDFHDRAYGDCDDQKKDCDQGHNDYEERGSGADGPQRKSVLSRIRELRDRSTTGGWQIW